MTQVTLEAVYAKQTELAKLTASLLAAVATPKTTRIEIPAAVVELRPGEHYAGEVLNEDGTLKHRLALVAVSPEAAHSWEGSAEFAKNLGYSRPTRAEARLLLANCRPHLPKEGWFWTDDAYEQNAAYAWHCYLSYGYAYGTLKSYEGLAVAVRRF
ncbi:DUF1566 domain-containing protein [Pandoraea sp. SD6-2]|uniref:DUF1566 domain-containing protein n=1 Tax=Pandoraea sp. SD6-2 TaxID=1286093 RepID=UPI00032FC95B|nr:DUF1566 domain-containing protein [Pandoraea sp. SD6-2]EON13436.1 hypothetical protein C266_11285 [Pandoraea sp. SD6-2]